MSSATTVQHLRKRLLRQRGRYRQIATHGRLTYSWVSKFAVGEVGKRPSYDLILRLRAALDAIEAAPAKVAPTPRLRNARRKATACRAPVRKPR